jgi:ParB-like chromosome segregation protein Spo0J
MTELTGATSEPQARGCNHALALVYRRLEDLKTDPANARIHSKKQIRQLARSINTFGFNIPVVVDGSLKVIAGHARVAIEWEMPP